MSFTIPDAIAALKTRSADVPRGEFITTIGPMAAMQFDERRLPNLMELDAVDRPVFIQAAAGRSTYKHRRQGMVSNRRGSWESPLTVDSRARPPGWPCKTLARSC
jgi:hypothetical protein